MLIILTILILICGVTLGIDEGMTMIQKRDIRFKWNGIEGVRGHEWYPSYHYIQCLGYTSACAVGEYIYLTNTTLQNILYTTGILLIGWQLFESFYSWTRYAEWVPESENVFGFYRTYFVAELIVVRLILAIGLVIMGVIK